MKIQFKLILIGFVVIAVLMGVVGFVTMRGFQNISVQMEEVVKENWPASQYISVMRESIREHSTAHSEYIEAALSKKLGASNEDVEAHYQLGNEIAMAAMEKFNKSFEDFEETKIFREVAAAAAADMNTLMDLEEKLEVAYRTENHDLAEETMNEFDNFVESTDENLAKIQSSINQRMDEALARANAAAAAAAKVLTVGIVAAVLLALGMGIFVSRQVAKPLKELQYTAARIVAGDYTARAKVTGKDEIGQLAGSFNQMVENLLGAEKYTQNIVQSMPTSLIVVEPDAKIKFVNPTTCELLGYTEKQLVGQPIEKIFGAAENIFKRAGLEKLIKEGTIKDERMMYLTKKGEEIPVAVSGSVMRDEKGKLQYIVVVAEDLREIKKYAAERLAKLTPVLQKVAMGDFSQNVKIPEKEDEFTEHLVALNLMIDDLKELTYDLKTSNQLLTATQKELKALLEERRKKWEAKHGQNPTY